MIERYMPSFTFMKHVEVSQEIGDTCSACLEKVCNGDYVKYQEKKAEEESVMPLTYFFGTFFELLFESDPTVEPLFASTNLRKQSAMLIRTFRTVAECYRLDRKKLRASLVTLAEKHTYQYKVHPMSYSYFADSLMRTLRRLLGKEFTREYEYSWLMSLSYVYSILIPAVVDVTMSTTLRKKHSSRALQEAAAKESASFSETRSRYLELTTAASEPRRWSVHKLILRGAGKMGRRELSEIHDLSILLKKDWDGLKTVVTGHKNSRKKKQTGHGFNLPTRPLILRDLPLENMRKHNAKQPTTTIVKVTPKQAGNEDETETIPYNDQSLQNYIGVM